jgi:hypothetical protein
MKQLTKVIFQLLFLVLIFSCSSDSDSSSNSSFKVNNETYVLIPSNGITIINQDAFGMKRSSVTVSGVLGTSKLSNVAFDLYRKPSENISGTYTIFDDENSGSDDINSFVQTNNRGCLGWTSLVLTSSFMNPSNQDSGNNPNPSANITITDNGNNSFTVKFIGSYRKYDDNFNVVGTIPVEMDVTTVATIVN